MDPVDPIAWLREKARSLGFFKLGVSRAGPLPGAERFDDWLARGLHGEMAWLERQAPKRRDPSLVLPDVRSIVVLAMNYHAGGEPGRGSLVGVISRYARGDDYHKVVADRLRQLLRSVERQFPGTRGLCYVDTGPISEKAWAAHCSLGWLGKHSNILTREQGSWFFLGVLLLTLELECDDRETDHCGTCDSCIRACPTGAIVAPYVLDARLCISYLTIEMRGWMPRALRPLIGNRIFGCDDCQEVCPWNRFAVTTSESAFAAREGLAAPELEGFVDISPAAFDDRFRGSAIRRARRDGFVRNVVVALGNSGCSEALPSLLRALRDAKPLVRGHAAWAIGRLGDATSRNALVSALSRETDALAAREIREALDQLR